MAAKMIPLAFGRVLRRQRALRDLTQETLALKSGVDRSYLSQLERGVRQPTLTTLCKLADTLGTSPSVLISHLEKELSQSP